ncbi:hypothetical protein E2562_018719 [Oryza meyeriana var. granulata]|uniref:F-box domain-containing protein n=1 Tax=Oryza meyeriana var. granulata TaxID=110450 RepID=A0A6G1EMR1_9ORYZ|nr:hypothetical protein E2562_018719 [Oryza meyeriana var. granulata]
MQPPQTLSIPRGAVAANPRRRAAVSNGTASARARRDRWRGRTTTSINESARRAVPPRDGTEEEIGNDDPLVEIPSRVPYKSLVRFNCVSRRWRRARHLPPRPPPPAAEVSAPGLRGLLLHHIQRYDCQTTPHRFTSIPAPEPLPLIDPSLSFVPKCERLDLMDSCNGLLRCSCWKINEQAFNYVVCNPGMKKWVVLPDSIWGLI